MVNALWFLLFCTLTIAFVTVVYFDDGNELALAITTVCTIVICGMLLMMRPDSGFGFYSDNSFDK